MTDDIVQGRNFRRRYSGMLASALLAVLALGGCATSGDVSGLNERLDAIDQRLEGLTSQMSDTEARVEAAEDTAANAMRRAEVAETNVSAAATRADEAAMKATRAFDKTIRK